MHSDLVLLILLLILTTCLGFGSFNHYPVSVSCIESDVNLSTIEVVFVFQTYFSVGSFFNILVFYLLRSLKIV